MIHVIYLDQNASTSPAPGMVEAMLPYLRDCYENPTGSHRGARRVREAVELARQQVAGLCGVRTDSVVFTSGATEAISLAIRSAERAGPPDGKVAISTVEHSAVREAAMAWFGKDRVVQLPVDPSGRIDLEFARELLENCAGGISLVCAMAANNETGILTGAEELIRITSDSGVPTLCDTVQVWGKLPIRGEWVKAAFSVVSGHKIGGPKGVGALVVGPGIPIHPLMFGGGQEGGRRSGTENVPAVVGLGEAARQAALRAADPTALADWEIRQRDFERMLREKLSDVNIIGANGGRLCNTSFVRFPGVAAEALLVLLDQAGVACSAGSSCQASGKPSPVLLAMGMSAAEGRECARFSSGPLTSTDELGQAVEIVSKAVARVRERMAPSGRVVRAGRGNRTD